MEQEVDKTYAALRLWCAARSQTGVSLSLGLDQLDALSLSMTLSALLQRLDEAKEMSSRVLAHAGAKTKDFDSSAALSVDPAALPSRRAAMAEEPDLPVRKDERFEIVGAMAGGMGVVTICYDHAQRFPFAIKTFRDDVFLHDVSTLASFTREARIWTGLGRHPHIVRAYGTRLIEDVPYLFLECVPGPTLKDLLRKGPFSPADAVEAALQVCSALRYARGVVHGDLKPSNLLFHRGAVKVTDFGLARDLFRQRQRSGAAGTPPYMAPEQWSGVGLSERTDVYALGTVLYELLAGHRPYQYDSIEEYREQRTRAEPPPAIPLAAPWSALNELLTRCLAKPQEARPSLRALQRHLRAIARPEEAQRVERDVPRRSVVGFFQGLAERFRERRRVREVLAFGSDYAGGIEEAIRRQLKTLSRRKLRDWDVQRLLALSKLRDAHPQAFAGWSAASLDFLGVRLAGRDLRRAFLPDADLAGLDLSGSDLRGACLRGAVLAGADLRRSKLRWADLSSAELAGAQLEKADLRKADLRGARLAETDLRGCQLAGANLRGAALFESRLDLSALPSIAELLAAPEREARLGALGLLGRIGPHPRVLVALLKPLRDPDETIWVRAAHQLAHFGPEAAKVAPLLLRRAAEASPGSRIALVEVLASIGDFRTTVPLPYEAWRQALDEQHARAAASWGDEGTRVVRFLVSCLHAPQIRLRVAAATALGQVRPRLELAVTALRQALGLEREVALAAARALGELAPLATAAVPELNAGLRRDDPELQVALLDSLARLGPSARTAISRMRLLAEAEDGDVRKAAERALQALASGPEGRDPAVSPG